MAIVIISGYFNPLHKGHIEYINNALKYGFVIAIVNNDFQVRLKKSKIFMDEEERVIIVKNLRYINEVFLSIDKTRAVNKTLRFIRKLYPEAELIFANGGDVTKCLEEETCKKLGIKILYGMGNKIQSSSKLKGNI